MAYVRYNPNPAGRNVGDCVIRAVSKIIGSDWEQAFINMAAEGLQLYDMPSSNGVLGSFLRSLGYRKNLIPDLCPECYTIKDFCRDHPRGTFLVATGDHVVAIVDGNYYDSSDTGSEIITYYYERR